MKTEVKNKTGSKPEDLSGKKFGKLTVLKLIDKRDPKKTSLWLCRCDCGNEKETSYRCLKEGNTKTCGQTQCNPNFINLKGEVFGSLTAIEMTDTRNSCGSVYWLCECKCGIRKNVDGSSLNQGRIKSCGKPECKPNFINISGKKFGNLTVIKVAKFGGHHGDTTWLCECNCGNTKIAPSTSLRNGSIGGCGLTQCKPGFIDLSGKEFGILRVLGFNGRNKNGQSLWNCECLCGKNKIIAYQGLIRDVGGATSCGCLRRKNQYESIKKNAYHSHKNSAKRRDLVTYLSYDEYILIASESCHYCGDIDLKTNPDTGAKIQLNGIDRKNNEPYYKLENSIPCCHSCNFIKMTMPYDNFIAKIKRIFIKTKEVLAQV